MQPGYNEIPGVYSETPRPLAPVRRILRRYQCCLGASGLVLLIIVVATVISVLVGKSVEEPKEKESLPKQSENSTVETLLSLPWPRRDEVWYDKRWKHSHMRRPFETENNTQNETRVKRSLSKPNKSNYFENKNNKWHLASEVTGITDKIYPESSISSSIWFESNFNGSYKRSRRAPSTTTETSHTEMASLFQNDKTNSLSYEQNRYEVISAFDEDHGSSEEIDDKEDFDQHDFSTFLPSDTFNWNRKASNLPPCSAKDIGRAMSESYDNERMKMNVEDSLMKLNISLRQNSPEFYHQKAFRKTWPVALEMSHQGFRMDHASKQVSNKLTLNREDSTFDLRWVGDLTRTPYCDNFKRKSCFKRSKYRNADGSCNNLRNPDWGASFTAFRRAMPPDYADGIMSPRVSKTGEELPNSREVSMKVHIHKRVNSDSYTFLAMTWGQFVDHDITATAQSKGQNGSSISCCNEQVLEMPFLKHPECYEIMIPDDDEHFRGKNVTCLEFSRSASAPRCTFGPRQQLNQNTHFLDGSIIYGSTIEQMNKLRNLKEGLLKTQVTIDGRQLLQPSLNPNDSCNTEFQMHWKQHCFISGDSRVNEHILLTTLHTVWTRQHNYIAGELLDINPHWDDEKIFQETRQIVVAQIQHITANEYLPIVLGPHFTNGMKLNPTFDGRFWKGYDPKIHPALANGFAGAAFRFGHSMIRGLMQSIDSSGANVKQEQLRKYFFNPFALYDPATIGDLIRGQVSQKSSAVDAYFTTQVTQNLFQRPGVKHGLDLVAINIQRGRDHGIPSYTRWRMMCGLPRIGNFSDLKHYFDKGTLNAISKVYNDVDDIDLYTGGLAEIPIKDGLVGPTFACIIADQFLRLKRGDRFWYENAPPNNSFTKDQLHEIHKITLARILCNTVNELGSIQRWPLRKFAIDNPRLPCHAIQISRMSLIPWEEWTP